MSQIGNIVMDAAATRASVEERDDRIVLVLTDDEKEVVLTGDRWDEAGLAWRIIYAAARAPR